MVEVQTQTNVEKSNYDYGKGVVQDMTDNKLIKALECCSGDGYTCTGCVLRNELPCGKALSRAALSLINRQKADIERMERRIEKLEHQITRNHLYSIPIPMPASQWLREELIEHCSNRCMEEL